LNEDREVLERRSSDREFQIVRATNLNAPSAIFVAVAVITRSDFPDERVFLIGCTRHIWITMIGCTRNQYNWEYPNCTGLNLGTVTIYILKISVDSGVANTGDATGGSG